MSGQQQLDLNAPVPITLPFGAWNTVLSLIAKGPWDVADPLMQVIRQQIQSQQQRAVPFRPQPVPQAPEQEAS